MEMGVFISVVRQLRQQTLRHHCRAEGSENRLCCGSQGREGRRQDGRSMRSGHEANRREGLHGHPAALSVQGNLDLRHCLLG